MSAPQAYDAIVIGTGQGGIPLALGLADAGWQVALIERNRVGGTCINTGCTPSKILVHRAQVAHYARHAARWGVRAADVGVDMPTVVAQKDRVVLEWRTGKERQIDQHPNAKLYRGTGRFVAPHRIAVGDELLEAEKIFINVGARPNVPKIPGLDEIDYLTNVHALALTTVPEHLLVLGGGYIGLEMGQMFARFGSRVTVIHRGDQILPREDPEVAAELQRALMAEGMEFRLGMRTTSAASSDRGIALAVEGPRGAETLIGSHLLVATGRQPNTGDLGLDVAGVEMDASGYVKVNGRLETTAPGVWALGDAKGGPAFTHISYNDYQILYGNLIEKKSLTIEGRLVPYCVFTDPQLGGVGMTEKEARAKGLALKIGRVPMTRVARAIERDETAGLMKLVVDAKTDRILGASILATDGGELVQVLSTLMLADRPYTLLKGAVYIHPTLAEGFFALMDDVKPT